MIFLGGPSKFFGVSAQYWLNLQSSHDLRVLEDDGALAKELNEIRAYTA